MKAFRFVRARTCAEAAEAVAATKGARLHAGGVDLLDRLKERLEEPEALISLIDVDGLDGVRLEADGAITLGARVTLAHLAESAPCARFLPTLAEAAAQAASPQLRHRATLGGNLAQHTRCGYYRLKSFPCLKRGGDHCPVRREGGVQETAGIFGNESCASAHPSSIAPVLGSLDADVLVRDAKALRVVPFARFWVAPEAGRKGDTILQDGEVIEAVRIPARDVKQHVGYSEIRQKAAFDWALVSCAVRYETEHGRVRDARVWFGSLAPTPWRSLAAEAALQDAVCNEESAAKAAEAAVAAATPLPGTSYKAQLARVAMRRALAAARGRA